MKFQFFILFLFFTTYSIGQDTIPPQIGILQEQLLNISGGKDSLKNILLQYLKSQDDETSKDDELQQQILDLKVGDRSILDLMYNNNGETITEEEQAALMQQFLNIQMGNGTMKNELVSSIPRFESLTDLYISQPYAMEYTGAGMYEYALHQKEIELEWESAQGVVDKEHADALNSFEEKYDMSGPQANTFGGEKEKKDTSKIAIEDLMTAVQNGEISMEEYMKVQEEYIKVQMGVATDIVTNPFEAVAKAGKVTWQQVQSKLPHNAAGIEFIHTKFRDGRWTETYNYYAMIVRQDFKTPLLIELGNADQLDKIFNNSKNLKPKDIYTRGGIAIGKKVQTGKELYDFVWSKVDKHLAGIKKVYYSPSGKLNALAFGALQDDEKTHLANKYELHQLGTTRALVDGISDLYAPRESCWIIAGDISYHEFPMVVFGDKNDACNIVRHKTINGAKLPPENELLRLEGAKVEINELSKKLTEQGVGFQVLSGTEATEEYFSGLGSKFPAPALIHIASHGFYLSDDVTLIENNFIDQQDGKLKVDPLSLSGLYLSGAAHQKHFKRPFRGRADGFWTAEEIAKQNLSNTKLVVLSACNSGLGDVKVRDGVFGLQRGFKSAGVKKMLVSLWEVDDEGTAVFMDYFYTHWLTGMTAFEAYQQTQKDMQNHKKYNTPYYWAGFVLLE